MGKCNTPQPSQAYWPNLKSVFTSCSLRGAESIGLGPRKLRHSVPPLFPIELAHFHQNWVIAHFHQNWVIAHFHQNWVIAHFHQNWVIAHFHQNWVIAHFHQNWVIAHFHQNWVIAPYYCKWTNFRPPRATTHFGYNTFWLQHILATTNFRPVLLLHIYTVTLNLAKQNFGCNKFSPKYDQAESSQKLICAEYLLTYSKWGFVCKMSLKMPFRPYKSTVDCDWPICCSLSDAESTGFGPRKLRCSVRPVHPIKHS